MGNRHNSKLILIAEDDPDISELMETVLESKGYETAVCMDGPEAVVQIKKLLPDLVIMDLWLPGIDGARVTKKLKSQRATKNIPVVIVSAQNRLLEVVKKSGADGFLNKPFDLSELLNCVSRHLGSEDKK